MTFDTVKRLILPGLAFKAFVIGGGYATGRELVEFFFPVGPLGGVLGLVLTMVIWSAVCAATFALARSISAGDYGTFFKALLGPLAPAFEVTWIALLILILAVFGAVAGALGAALFGWPTGLGTGLLAAAAIAVLLFGSAGTERLFALGSLFLYAVYALFVGLAFAAFGDGIADTLSGTGTSDGWVSAGLTYASYNVVGAVIVLPALRRLRSVREGAIAGLLAGPLAILPGAAFFLCMLAFYPEIGAEALPSDRMLAELDLPAFRYLFQAMVFVALLETSVSALHAVNERIAAARRRRHQDFHQWERVVVTSLLLLATMWLASELGLVALIATGYRAIAVAILIVFILPLMTVGLYRLVRRGGTAHPVSPHPQHPPEIG